MHGEEQHWVDEAIRTNWVSTVGANIDAVEKALMKHNHYEVAKSYVIYRDEHLKNKKYTPDEEKALAICSATSEDVSGDNDNCKTLLKSTEHTEYTDLFVRLRAAKYLI